MQAGHQPKISVVVPSFNQGRFLGEALESVFGQDYPNSELIVIDGGSRDGSVDIIRRYESRLRYWVSEPDRGQSHAINKGFARCTGDIVTFLGSDDSYLPGTFCDLAARWPDLEPYGAVVGAFFFRDDRAGRQAVLVQPMMKVQAPVDLTLGPPGAYRLHQAATFYLQRALDDVGRHLREDLHYVMDRELLYRVCRKYPVLLVDTPYGVFRRHGDSKSLSATLPFSREFSRLYLDSRIGDPADDHKRARMARYRLTRGYLKHAASAEHRTEAASSLLKALVGDPVGCMNAGYLSVWKRTFSRKGEVAKRDSEAATPRD